MILPPASSPYCSKSPFGSVCTPLASLPAAGDHLVLPLADHYTLPAADMPHLLSWKVALLPLCLQKNKNTKRLQEFKSMCLAFDVQQ